MWRSVCWLDIRRIDVLGPIMAKRLDMCAVGHVQGQGLHRAHRISAHRRRPAPIQPVIARLARDRRMSVGLKNDLARSRPADRAEQPIRAPVAPPLSQGADLLFDRDARESLQAPP
jgi:hypothetical protein